MIEPQPRTSMNSSAKTTTITFLIIFVIVSMAPQLLDLSLYIPPEALKLLAE
jgi:hypothetical protein